MITWRDKLKELISNPQELKRISICLDLKPRTIVRWVEEDRSPPLDRAGQLVRAVPSLLPYILQDFPLPPSVVLNILNGERVNYSQRQERNESLPYDQVLQIIAESREFQAICQCVLPHALQYIDPEVAGGRLTVLTLVDSLGPEGTARSLIENARIGNPPWKTYSLMGRKILFGSESLPGYAVIEGTWQIIPDMRKQNTFSYAIAPDDPVPITMAAFPLKRDSKVAGCLVASSGQENAFSSSQIEGLRKYASLLSLGYPDEMFRYSSHIMLGIMPAYEVQEQFFSDFQNRVNARDEGLSLSERTVLNEIEAALLEYSSSQL